MRSSKIENIFNYTPPVEDAKTLSPFTYYQPFQSSFDPDFSVPPPKANVRYNPPHVKRRGHGVGERPSGGLHVAGGGILGHVEGGFGRRVAPHGGSPCPEASTSSWGDAEGRSLCNSTWRGPASPRPSYSGYQGPKQLAPGVAGLAHDWARGVDEGVGQFFSNGAGGSLRTGGSLCPAAGQVASFDGSLGQSTYYPLMLSPLGRNVGQNVYKTGYSRPMVCNFCKNNKEVPDIYLNHYLYDPETKVLSCPVLRKHVCEICGGTGDQAHTLQYCPVNRERGLQSKVPVLLKTRTITNSTGKIRRN